MSPGTSGTAGVTGATGGDADVVVAVVTPSDASTPEASDGSTCTDPLFTPCNESFTIGSAGGTIVAGNETLTIPPGALEGATAITLEITP